MWAGMLYTDPRKYVIETKFGAKMEIFKSAEQHHNVIITAGCWAREIIENTNNNLDQLDREVGLECVEVRRESVVVVRLVLVVVVGG